MVDQAVYFHLSLFFQALLDTYSQDSLPHYLLSPGYRFNQKVISSRSNLSLHSARFKLSMHADRTARFFADLLASPHSTNPSTPRHDIVINCFWHCSTFRAASIDFHLDDTSEQAHRTVHITSPPELDKIIAFPPPARNTNHNHSNTSHDKPCPKQHPPASCVALAKSTTRKESCGRQRGGSSR